MNAQSKRRLLLITGAERSGTTFLQRLLVSSRQVVPVVGEFPLLPSVLYSLGLADDQFSFFYRDYLGNRQLLWRRGGDMLRGLVNDVFDRFPDRSVLAVKAPALGEAYADFSRVFPRSETLVVFRHPLDAIASLKKVAGRARAFQSHGSLAARRDDIAFLTERFLGAYTPFVGSGPGERTTFIRYEALAANLPAAIPVLKDRHALSGLRADLASDADRSEYISKERPEAHRAFWSEGYRSGPLTSRIGSFAEVLSEDETKLVRERTKAYCEWCGYDDQPRPGGSLMIAEDDRAGVAPAGGTPA